MAAASSRPGACHQHGQPRLRYGPPVLPGRGAAQMLGGNCFADLESSVKGNKAREFFVSREDTEKILAACPNIEWKLIVSLARFAGLRTPSETLLLRWGDVLWDEHKLFVRIPMGGRRFELLTSCVSSTRSSQLS